MSERYTLEIRENGKRLSKEPIADPFHRTTIHVRGWRAALDVLLRRHTVEVAVDANAETIRHVMAGRSMSEDERVEAAYRADLGEWLDEPAAADDYFDMNTYRAVAREALRALLTREEAQGG